MEFKLILCFALILANVLIYCQNLDKLRDSVTKEEQRAFIKLNVLLDTSPRVVTAQLETALPTTHLSQSQVYYWFNEFKQGKRTDISDLPKPGRTPIVTSDDNKQKVRELILESEGIRTEDIIYELKLSESSVLRILHDIGAKKLKSRYVPHQLTERQIQVRMNIAGKLLARYQRESDFLNKIVAIDETWLKSYDPKDTSATSEWLLPQQKR
jgi:hypothetical protein